MPFMLSPLFKLLEKEKKTRLCCPTFFSTGEEEKKLAPGWLQPRLDFGEPFRGRALQISERSLAVEAHFVGDLLQVVERIFVLRSSLGVFFSPICLS